MPASMRMVEPELPQSSVALRLGQLPASPVMVMDLSSCFSTLAPSASIQARVEWGSAPVEKLVRRVVPEARPPSMA